MANPDPGFGIYIHWPFCAAKCPYCDFNSHVERGVDQGAWADALVADLRRQARTWDQEPVTSIFFGGGTPSLMAPAVVAEIIDAVAKDFAVAGDVEISLEANPTSVETANMAGFRSAGVNRVSLGVQALNDADLKRLGRMHSQQEAIAAFDAARALFDRVSFDLIYARQDQSLAAWEAELTRALELAVDHLSLYQLTIEPGTRFGDMWDRGALLGLPDGDLAADMFDLTNDLCQRAGFDAYEVSNHARPGAACRHNLTYWHYGAYVGIGPGAHGRPRRKGHVQAVESIRTPRDWRASGRPWTATALSPREAGLECLLMGLRLRAGIDRANFRRLTGQDLAPGILTELQELGLLICDDTTVAATHAGRRVLNAVIERLSDGWVLA